MLKMRKKLLISLVLIVVFLIACQKAPEAAMEKKEAPGDAMVKEEPVTPTQPVQAAQPSQQPTTQPSSEAKLAGKVLAGTTTPYIEYNKADYELALQSKPYVVLYFYANWCPICKAEQPHTFAAFDELQRTDMVGFRVNFRDSETDDDEVGLARQFGVTYQHTKVVLKNGERVLKSPETWSKEDYLENLNKI